jgi:hypothetical protein
MEMNMPITRRDVGIPIWAAPANNTHTTTMTQNSTLRVMPVLLQPSHQHQNNQDDKNDAKQTNTTVAKTVAIATADTAETTNKNHNYNNQQDDA